MKRSACGAAICAAATLAALPATAQQPSPPQAEARAAAPAARSEPEHLHEGLYFRLGLGIGWLRTASSFEGTIGARPASEVIGDLTYTGYGLAADVAIGGTLVPGVVMGYGFAWQLADDPTLRVENTANADGETERRDPLGAFIHGLLFDVFPDPRGNLELGALFGAASTGTGGDGKSSTGLGGQVWGGYGFWAAREVSLIALLRLSFARTLSNSALTSSTNGVPNPRTTIDRTDATFTVGVVTGLLLH